MYLCFGLSKLASKIYERIFYFINVLILSLAFTSKELLHKFCHSTLPIKFLPNLPDGSQEKARKPACRNACLVGRQVSAGR